MQKGAEKACEEAQAALNQTDKETRLIILKVRLDFLRNMTAIQVMGGLDLPGKIGTIACPVNCRKTGSRCRKDAAR